MRVGYDLFLFNGCPSLKCVYRLLKDKNADFIIVFFEKNNLEEMFY